MEVGSLTTRRSVPLAISTRHAAAAAVGAVTVIAAVLRFGFSFASIRPNPFYDAAVRSMSLSWHNFFYGAFEPGGSVSIDKTPVDLWLQVASVKALGFSSFALRLPEALASTAAVPLLYALVTRLFGRAAGLASAAALAVLPVAVVTGRSDTMDSVMMALLILVGWLVVRSAQSRRTSLLVAAGAVMGLAFNVKLFQALVALPPFGLLYFFAAQEPLRARLRSLAAGGVAFIGVALSWVTIAGLASPGSRPYPIGSTNGGVWNVIFGFNGIDRLRVKPTPGAAGLDPAGPARLFGAHGLFYGSIIGSELLAALVLGGLALVVGAVLARRGAIGGDLRRARAGAIGIGLWLVAGAVLFSKMGRLHPRYLEAFTPAVAAGLGIGIVVLGTMAARHRGAAVALGAGVMGCVLIASAFARSAPAADAIAAVAVVAMAAGCTLLARRRVVPNPARLASVVTVLALVAVLAAPVSTSLHLSSVGASLAGRAGSMPDSQVASLSRFLTAHRQGARYELVSSSVAKAGPLIVRDAQPVLMLTTLYGRPFTTPVQLASAVRSGKARYALLDRGRCAARTSRTVDCAPSVRWARAHGTDVSSQAGLRGGLLYRLSVSPEHKQ